MAHISPEHAETPVGEVLPDLGRTMGEHERTVLGTLHQQLGIISVSPGFDFGAMNALPGEDRFPSDKEIADYEAF